MEFFGTTERVINDALQSCARGVKRLGSAWSFELLNGRKHSLRARFTHEHWLVLEAQLFNAAGRVDPCGLLQMNGRLAEGLKFVLAPQPGLALLRAEIFLNDETDVRERTRKACAELERALHGFYVSDLEEKRDYIEGERGIDLRAACSEAGWAFNERAEGNLTVELETRRGFHRALIERAENGRIRSHVGLAAGERLSDEGRRALPILLLRLCARLKMVRAAITESGESISSACLESVLPQDACVTEFSYALSALSMACDMCAGEVEAIIDKSVAARYLAAQGWS